MTRAPSIRPFLLAALALVAAVALPAAAAPAAGATIGVIRKQHGVEMADGRKAVQLTVPADIVGEKGQVVWMAVWFTDAAGKPLPTNDAGYGDADGNLKVVSLDTAITREREGLDFVFRVPYIAFPRRKDGRYQVVANVKLIRRDTPKNRILALGATSFFVEG